MRRRRRHPFGRTDGLYPVATALFYGALVVPTYFTTVGGLKVSTKMEVLKADGTAVPGLYAAGCDAAGLYGYEEAGAFRDRPAAVGEGPA